MGTWSIKPYGNDTALDWFSDLQSSKNSSEFLASTIQNVLKEFDGDSYVAEKAVAAVALVSAAASDPVRGISQEVKSWISTSGFVPSMELVENSAHALDVITKESELYDLWAETSSLDSWLKNVASIKAKLSDVQKKNVLPDRKPKKKALPRVLYKLIEYYASNPDEKVREKIFAKLISLENINEGGKETDYDLPLVLVSRYGLLREAEYLLSKGCDMDAKAFIWACVNCHFDLADLLLSKGLKMFDETIMDENTGYSYNPELYKKSDEKPTLSTRRYCLALFSVASIGKPQAVDYLVSKGADVHQLDLNGETLIHKACHNKNMPTLERFIELGVNIDASKGIVNGNKKSKGQTALHYAVSKGFTEGVRLLLEKGADPNIIEYFYGSKHSWENTPLDLISDEHESEMHNLLRHYGGMKACELE